MSLQYWAFSWTFFAVPVEQQWVLALLLPFTRELGNIALTAICAKAPACNIDESISSYHLYFDLNVLLLVSTIDAQG